MAPMMCSKVTFSSHSRGMAGLTQSEGDCTAHEARLTGTTMEGMKQGKGNQRRRKTSVLDAQEATSKNGKNPTALSLKD